MTEWGTDQTKLLGREGDPQTCLKTEWPGLSTVFIYLVGSFILCQALCRGADKKRGWLLGEKDNNYKEVCCTRVKMVMAQRRGCDSH